MLTGHSIFYTKVHPIQGSRASQGNGYEVARGIDDDCPMTWRGYYFRVQKSFPKRNFSWHYANKPMIKMTANKVI